MNTRGQSTVEYAVCIAVVVAALLAMQIYMKRGVQGKLRSATDDVGEQFSPTAYKANFKIVQKSATEDTLHVAAKGQGSGASKSDATVPVKGITGIENTRNCLAGKTPCEQLTDDQSADKLF